MSSKLAKEFENIARDCVNMAQQAHTPELRDRLLEMAGEWMQAAMDEEDWEKHITSSYPPRTRPAAG